MRRAGASSAFPPSVVFWGRAPTPGAAEATHDLTRLFRPGGRTVLAQVACVMSIMRVTARSLPAGAHPGAASGEARSSPSARRSAAAMRALRTGTVVPIVLGVLFAAALVGAVPRGGTLRLALAALLATLGALAALALRHEVTELVATYDEALERDSRLRERAEGACRARDAVLRSLGRELRAPLNAILGWTALLQRSADDPATVRRATETIDRSARAQARLVAELETFPKPRGATVEAGGASAEPAERSGLSLPTLDARDPRPPS